MSEPRFDHLLAAAPSPPSELLEVAETEASRLAAVRRSRIRRRLAGWIGGAFLCIGFAFTAPGQAATQWVADLAGFGEEPSLNQSGSVPGTAVVLASGTLDDGTPYEVVAKKVLFGRGPDTRTESDSRLALLCIQVDFTSLTSHGQGGHCSDGAEMGTGLGPESTALYSVDANGQVKVGVPGSVAPALWVGLVETNDADSVEVFTTRDGRRDQEIASTLVDVDGAVLSKTGTGTPMGVFVAPISSDTIDAGLKGDLEVRAVARSATGEEVGHSDLGFCLPSMPAVHSEGVPLPPRVHPIESQDGSDEEPTNGACAGHVP